MFRHALSILGLVIALVSAGCSPSTPHARAETVVLSEWSLVGSGEAVPIALPDHVDDRVTARDAPFTLAKRVALPREMRGQDLTLAIPQLRSRVELRCGGRVMAPLDFEEGYRGSHHPRFRIPSELTDVDTLDLDLRVENTWTQSTWLDASPRLSATSGGDAWYRFVRAANTITAIAALITVSFVAFSYFIVFALDRRKHAHGWFALEAIFGAAYPAFQLGLTTYVFGRYEGAFLATSLTAALIASVHFSHAQFGLLRPRWALDLLVPLTAIASLIFPGPFELTPYVAPFTVIAIFGNVGYQLVLNGRELRRSDRPIHALVLLASWGVLGIVGAVDFLAWAGLGELFGGLRGACLGIFSIAAFRSAVLSRDHFEALHRSDALNAELAERVRLLEASNVEVVVLNGELRRQISARSEQMANILSRAGTNAAFTARVLAVGDVVDERYRVVKCVGTGGMGAVYEVARCLAKNPDARPTAEQLAAALSGAVVRRTVGGTGTALGPRAVTATTDSTPGPRAGPIAK